MFLCILNMLTSYAVISRLSAHFGSHSFWLDKRKVWISKTPDENIMHDIKIVLCELRKKLITGDIQEA